MKHASAHQFVYVAANMQVTSACVLCSAFPLSFCLSACLDYASQQIVTLLVSAPNRQTLHVSNSTNKDLLEGISKASLSSGLESTHGVVDRHWLSTWASKAKQASKS